MLMGANTETHSIGHAARPVVTAVILVVFMSFMPGCTSASSDSIAEQGANPGMVAETSAQMTLDDRTREALLAALDDERKAEAFYRAVIAKLGEIRPFSNIVNAEVRHQTMLLPLLKRYGIAVPANPYDGAHFDVPATRAEACAMGVTSEVENIALYDRLLPTIVEADIKSAFSVLRAASADRHLPAFERCAGR